MADASGEQRIDISRYVSPFGWKHKLRRAVWNLVWGLLFRPSPRVFFGWRNALLRCWGARIGRNVHIYPSCRIWAPWNLRVDDRGCLADGVICYCVDLVTVGAHATVSQYSHLCTATHDPDDPHMRLVTRPIRIESESWVCADVFIGPGVTVGQGAVAGARAVVVKDIEPWMIVAGNPARPLRKRRVREASTGAG